LLLLDAPGKRISVLFVPSGMTKKKLPGVSPLSKDFKCFDTTINGWYFCPYVIVLISMIVKEFTYSEHIRNNLEHFAFIFS